MFSVLFHLLSFSSWHTLFKKMWWPKFNCIDSAKDSELVCIHLRSLVLYRKVERELAQQCLLINYGRTRQRLTQPKQKSKAHDYIIFYGISIRMTVRSIELSRMFCSCTLWCHRQIIILVFSLASFAVEIILYC